MGGERGAGRRCLAGRRGGPVPTFQRNLPCSRPLPRQLVSVQVRRYNGSVVFRQARLVLGAAWSILSACLLKSSQMPASRCSAPCR